MAITVFDAVGKFSADTSQLDQFIAKLEQGLPSASDRAAAATKALKSAQDDFRAAIKAVSAEGGNTADNLNRLAEAEKNLTLASAASRAEHAALKQSLGDVKTAVESSRGSMLEARHTIQILGEQIGVAVPRAVSGMIASIGPLGGLLSAAFPIAGAVALIAVIGKVIEHLNSLEEARRKAAAAAVNQKISEEDQTNALEVQNLRIEDAIRKLEGRPATNQLAIALREVQDRADQLATTFAKDFESMDKDVAELNGFVQKGTDYIVNYLKAFSDFFLSDMGQGVKELQETFKARGEETDAIKEVQHAELALQNARMASHDAATKDADTQRNALNSQAAAAYRLQKAYEDLAGEVEKVDPNNETLINKLRSAALSAQSDWKDIGKEIRTVGLTAKQTADEIFQEFAKRAAELSKIDISHKEKMGILDADAIRQAGEQAFTAEQDAIKKILDADEQAGQSKESAELSLIPRMRAAQEALNTAILAAMKAGHEARISELQAELADAQKYLKGDERLKAVKQLNNQIEEENAQFELQRQKTAADGEQKLNAIAEKGAADRIALQNALKAASLELVKADQALLQAQTKLGQADISQTFKNQEAAINSLAQFHVISESEKAARLAILYKQESDSQVQALQDAQQKIALNAVKENPIFTPAQLADLKKNLAAAAGDFDATVAAIRSTYGEAFKNPLLTDAQIAQLKSQLAKVLVAVTQDETKLVTEKTQINQKLLALDKSYYGEAVSMAVANGQKLLAQQLMENHELLVSAEQRLAEAKSRQENTAAIEQEVSSLRKSEQELTREALGRRVNQTAILNAVHAATLEAQAELAAAKARGANTSAIEAQIKELQKLESELKKVDQQTISGNKQQLTSWQQFSTGFRNDIQKNQVTLEQMGQKMQGDIATLTTDMGAAFAAMALGQESAGEAIEKAMAKVIASIAQQWAEYFAAMAIADIFFDPAKAAAEIAAAVALEALAGILGSVGSSSKSSSSTQSKGTAVSSKDQGVKTQPQPTQTVNVTHLATGGIATGPTPAIVGDSENQDQGAGSPEAIIPLNDHRALDMIAAALVPALAKFFPQQKNALGESSSFAAGSPSLLTIHTLLSRETIAIASGPVAAAGSPIAASAAKDPIELEAWRAITNMAREQAKPLPPSESKVEIVLKSDIKQTIKGINHEVKTGRAKLHSSTTSKTIKQA